MRNANASRTRRAAVGGFAVGTLLAVLYVAVGGSTWWFVPRWAAIAFYPGFFAGGCVYAWVTENYFACVGLGCLAVGVAYGAFAAAGFAVYGRLAARNRFNARADLSRQ